MIPIPRNKNQKDFKKKYLLAGINPGYILMLTQTQQQFEEEKTQLFPGLWSHCCSSVIRAQPSMGKWGQQPRAPVSSCYGIEARKVLHMGAAGSSLLESSWHLAGAWCRAEETKDPTLHLISCLHPMWMSPVPRELRAASCMEASLCLGSHVWVTHSPLQRQITFLTTLSNCIELLRLQHICCS